MLVLKGPSVGSTPEPLNQRDGSQGLDLRGPKRRQP
jgi:hypothetical protein